MVNQVNMDIVVVEIYNLLNLSWDLTLASL